MILTLLTWVLEHIKSVKSPICMGRCIWTSSFLKKDVELMCGWENKTEFLSSMRVIILLRSAERLVAEREANSFKFS